MFVYTTTIWAPYHETICRELEDRLRDEFRLVLTEPVDTERNLGWDLTPPSESWIVPPPRKIDDIEDGPWAKLILDADVAVIGAVYGHRSLFRSVDARVHSGKKTLFMMERPFKQGLRLRDFLRPYNWYVWWRLHRRYNHQNVHILAIGNGVREDLKFLHVHKASIHSWAYFPALSERPIEKTKSDFLRICWCGRMIPCKHVDVLIEALALLSREVRSKCKVTIAGEGEMRDAWIDFAGKLGVADVIKFLPMLPHEEALKLMSESDVYVFPSDGEEGWGVALEEAMDRCCVPIACIEAGAPKALLTKECGYLISSGDAKAVAHAIGELIEQPERINELGNSAWKRVQLIGPSVGAEKLISMSR